MKTLLQLNASLFAANGNIGKLSGVIGADMAAPLPVPLQDLPPGLLIGQFAHMFGAVVIPEDGSRTTRPAIASISQAHQTVRLIDPHATQHLKSALQGWRPGTEDPDRQPHLGVQLGTHLTRFGHGGDIARLADEDARPRGLQKVMKPVTGARRGVSRSRAGKQLLPVFAEDRLIQIWSVLPRCDVHDSAHLYPFQGKQRKRAGRPATRAGPTNLPVRCETFPYAQHRTPGRERRILRGRTGRMFKGNPGTDRQRVRGRRNSARTQARSAAMLKHVHHLQGYGIDGGAGAATTARLALGNLNYA